MEYPLSKYKFFVFGNQVVAVSTYAGKTVRGVAKCHPDDAYDVEKGKMLAALRCNARIAEKRLNRANEKVKDATRQLVNSQEHYSDMRQYQDDAFVGLRRAHDELNLFIKNEVKHG